MVVVTLWTSRRIQFLLVLCLTTNNNNNWIAVAKQYGYHRPFPAFSDDESSSIGDFQSSSSYYDQEEERVLLAMARTERKRHRKDGHRDTFNNHPSVHQVDTFSDDTLSSDHDRVTNSQKVGRKTNLAVTPGVVPVESSRPKRETMASSMRIPGSAPLNTAQQQSTTIPKKNPLPKKTTNSPIQPKANKQKASSTTTPWIRQYLSSRPKDGKLVVYILG